MTVEPNLHDIVKDKLSVYGFPHNTASLFSDLNSVTQNELKLVISRYNVGEPLVFYAQIIDGWVTICTNAIAIKREKEITILALAHIKNINSDQNEWDLKRALYKNYKFELSNWVITDVFDNIYLISLDKGKIYYSFYHVLIKILRTKGFT